MLCDSCKSKNASIHYTNVINGQVKKLNLCEECALNNKNLEPEFSFHKLLTSLIGSFQYDTKIENIEDIEDSKCSNCGLSFEEFKNTGKFGCPICYESFSDQINPILSGIHGHTNHIGKTPEGSKEYTLRNRDIINKRLELEDLVKAEAFEEAAILRDEIRKLEDEISSIRGEDNGKVD